MEHVVVEDEKDLELEDFEAEVVDDEGESEHNEDGDIAEHRIVGREELQ